MKREGTLTNLITPQMPTSTLAMWRLGVNVCAICALIPLVVAGVAGFVGFAGGMGGCFIVDCLMMALGSRGKEVVGVDVRKNLQLSQGSLRILLLCGDLRMRCWSVSCYLR